MRRSVVAAAMAASLTAGGAAGVALFTPSLSGAESEAPTEQPATDHDVDRHRPLLTERLREQLDDLVEDEVISDEQADAVAEHLAERSPLRNHRPAAGGAGFPFGGVLDALGVDPTELRDQFRSGQSLGEIAEATDVDVDAVLDAVIAAHQDRLSDAVADGRLTQPEADERAAAFEERLRALVDRFGQRVANRHGDPGS